MHVESVRTSGTSGCRERGAEGERRAAAAWREREGRGADAEAAAGVAAEDEDALDERDALSRAEVDLEFLVGAAGTVVADVSRTAARCEGRAERTPRLGLVAGGGVDDGLGLLLVGAASGSVGFDASLAATRREERVARPPELGLAANGGDDVAGEDASRTFHDGRLELESLVARGAGSLDLVTTRTLGEAPEGTTAHACSTTPDSY